MKKIHNYFKKLFYQLKISKGNSVIVYSNLSTFGINNKYLPLIVIDQLKKAVGVNGTIFMPLYTLGGNVPKIFNKNNIYENKFTNLLAKNFFKEKKIRRSNCPIHSHIGLGKKTNILSKSNPSNSYGKNSDFDFMKKNKFKLLLLGCSPQEGATYFHQIEAVKNLNYGKWISFKRKIFYKNKVKNINVNFFEKKNVKHNLNKALNVISKKSKTFLSIKNKYYKSTIINIDELHGLTLKELKKNPYFLIKNEK